LKPSSFKGDFIMEHQHAPSTITPERPFRVHPVVWLIAAGIVAALVAIFIFKVEIGTVFTYERIR
jgi:hypothetical protein